jgi:hypothetical protein
LLIDEFQDTDEVQAQIISLLAEDRRASAGSRRKADGRWRRAIHISIPPRSTTVFFGMLERILDEGGVIDIFRTTTVLPRRLRSFRTGFRNRWTASASRPTSMDGVTASIFLIGRFTEPICCDQSQVAVFRYPYVAAESG